MQKNRQYISTALLITLLGLLLMSWVSAQETWILSYMRIWIGAICLLFLPWYRVTKAVFDHKEEQDILEVIALSFAFSISVVPLLVFYTNLVWIPIWETLVYAVVIAVILWAVWRIEYRTGDTSTSSVWQSRN